MLVIGTIFKNGFYLKPAKHNAYNSSLYPTPFLKHSSIVLNYTDLAKSILSSLIKCDYIKINWIAYI